MKTVGEWIDYTNEIADKLEKEADKKCKEEINKAQAYAQGYHQAIEDYARETRKEIRNNQS